MKAGTPIDTCASTQMFLKIEQWYHISFLSAISFSFFQIKVDIPPECRIYPIDSEDEEEETGPASRGGGGNKEIICPWESLTPHNGTG